MGPQNTDKNGTVYEKCENQTTPQCGEAMRPEGEYLRGIGWAVKQLEHGAAVARHGWNGKRMALALQRPDIHSKMTLPYIFMVTAQGQKVPWIASQTDILSTDWFVTF